MPESMQTKAKSIFSHTLKTKPYCVVLYNSCCETRTMIVDEARDVCKIEYYEVIVHNCHGTDVDEKEYYSKDYTLEQMAVLLDRLYSPAAIAEESAGIRLNYKEEAHTYAPKLREAGKAFATVQSVGKALLHIHLPDFQITKLHYASPSAAVFDAINQAGEACIVKMSQISKEQKAVVDASFNTIMQLGGNHNLLPIYGKLWIPLDTQHEILVIWQPLMETIGTDSEKFYVIPKGDRIQLGIELARALKALHENGLVHHDVKPENLFIRKSEKKLTWYLGDFGSVKPLARQYEGKTSGTMAYMAPEILEKKPFSYSSDVYSWGCAMFFLWSNYIPHSDERVSVSVKENEIRLHSQQTAKSSRYIDDHRLLQLFKIIAKALDPNPLERYASGKELLEALEKIDEASETVNQSQCHDQAQGPHEKFYNEMRTKPSFRSAFSYAKAEINSVIIKKIFGIKAPSGNFLTTEDWETLSEPQQLQYILAMGNHGIVPSVLLCIDFVEIIPYCLAITLLYIAYTGQKETQLLDTGDGADIAVFNAAVNSLKGCYAKWDCNILTQ